MKKPISLWIAQVFIFIGILLLIYHFISNGRLLISLYSAPFPQYIKIEIYFVEFILGLVLAVQVLSLYFTYVRSKFARIFTILAWVAIYLIILRVQFKDGFDTVSNGVMIYENEAQRAGALLSKYVIAGLFGWLTVIILFSKKIKDYFYFK